MGTVRFLGTFLADPLDVPWAVVDFLAGQLGIEDASVVKRYSERAATANVHAREIRQVYGYRDLAGPLVGELTEFVSSRAWTHGEGPTALFDQATAWLRRGRVLLPGVSVLARLVAGTRDQETARMYAQVHEAACQFDPSLAGVLGGLLAAGESEQVSRLEALRAGPTRLSGPELDKALGRVARVRELGVSGVDLSDVPVSRVRALARFGLGAKAQTLRRLAEPRRTATLVATVAALESAAVDDALDLFDVLMATRVLGPSKRAAQAERLARMPELEKASSVLARVGAELVRVLDEAGEQVDVAAAWAALERVAGRDRITQAVAAVGAIVPDESGEQGAMREQMARRFRTVAPFLGLMATAIPWGSTTARRSVLGALTELDALRGRRKVRREEIDASLVPPAWRAAVFGRADEVEVDRDAWVVCVLEQLRAGLRRRDVFAVGSTRWGDPRAQLLDGHAWDAVRDQALRSMSLEGPVTEHLGARVEVLDAAWKGLTDAIGESGPGASVRLSEQADGRVKLAVAPLDALEILECSRFCGRGFMPRVRVLV